jgi:hypothetical protein
MVSANRLWKQSGSTLPFKHWLEGEKSRGRFIPNVLAQEEFNNADGSDEPTEEPTKTDVKSKLEVGSVIGKNLLIISAIAIGIYFVYTTYKKNAQ